MSTPQHPLLLRYLARTGIGEQALRADGRATIVIDDRYRVHLQPDSAGWLSLMSRIVALPAAGIARDRLLLEMGRLAAGMLSAHASGCVIDEKEEAVWLQQSIRPDSSDVDVDEAIGQFANALSFWTRAAGRLA